MNSPLPPHPKYTIERRYNRFRIIRWRQVAEHWEGDTVGEFDEYEMARKVLYDLNGWNYKPKKLKNKMAILTYKCNIAKEKRPKWLHLLTYSLMNAQQRPYEGTRNDFDHLKYSLDKYLDQLRMGQILTSRVTTEIREDSGETVLFVKRNGTVLLSIYIK